MGVALVRKDRAAVASTVTVRHTGMSAQSCTLTAIGCTTTTRRPFDRLHPPLPLVFSLLAGLRLGHPGVSL